MPNFIENKVLNEALVSSLNEETCLGPLFSSQRRLWIIENYSKELSIAYNHTYAWRISGALDIPSLIEALNRAANLHPSLRTSFVLIKEKIYQKINHQIDIPFKIIEKYCGNVSALITEENSKYFNIFSSPLIRGCIIMCSEKKYYFTLTMHHLICDSASIPVFLQDISALYFKCINNETNENARLNYEYIYKSLFVNEPEIKPSIKKFWINYLKDLTQTRLPAKSTTQQQYCSDTIYVSAKQSLMQAINFFCSKHSVLIEHFIFTAFNILLSVYASQSDIIIGNVYDMRPANQKKLVALISNILPIRSFIDLENSFLQLLNLTMQNLNMVEENKSIYFDKLVELINPKRTDSSAPIIQIKYDHRNTALHDSLSLKHTDSKTVFFKKGFSRFDLTLTSYELQDKLIFEFEYNSTLLERNFVKNMTHSFIHILNNIIINSDLPLNSIELLAANEVKKIRSITTGPIKKHYLTGSVIDLFNSIVKKKLSSTALVFENISLTYHELDERSTVIAKGLAAIGVQKGDIIGIYIERSIEQIIAIFAILKCCAAFMPLEVDYPAERINYMIQDSGAKIIIVNTLNLAEMTKSEMNFVSMKELESKGKETKNHYSFASPTLEQLAYVYYTSGSTGVPKGVKGSHLSILNRIKWMYSQYPFTSDAVCCYKTPFSSIPAIWDIFQPLLAGIKLIIFPKNYLTDLSKFFKIIQQQQITRIGVVPTLLERLLDYIEQNNVNIPSLSFWEIGGELVSSALAESFYQTLPHAILVNRYGATEAASIIDGKIKPKIEGVPYKISLGHPIANTKLFILNDRMHCSPIGVIGEIYVASAGLAIGYLNDIDSEKNDFMAVENFQYKNQIQEYEYFYRTGDYGRITFDNTIELVSRKNSLVKIFGFKIDLNEIEMHLNKYFNIKNTKILAIKSNDREKLVAFYQLKCTHTSLQHEDLIVYLKKKIPSYMIPENFYKIDKFPELPNGKFNKAGLISHYNQYLSSRTSLSPITDIEKSLLLLTQSVLNDPTLTLQDNFFESGGNSISAISLLFKIENTYNVRLSLHNIFEAREISHIVDFVKKRQIIL